MVAFAAEDADSVFDPAFGLGAFAAAGARLELVLNRRLVFSGCELDEAVLREARASGRSHVSTADVAIGDFLQFGKVPPASGIVANPPYIRHHRLGEATKARLRRIALAHIGRALDGRAGIHVYFLIHALKLLGPERRLAFIVPADTCEGVFASRLWTWILAQFRLEAVVTFEPEATPFPGVDTNPVVLLISNRAPAPSYAWVRCAKAGSPSLLSWVRTGMRPRRTGDLIAIKRSVADGARFGISRRPDLAHESPHVLGDFARVMRGIATGANDFFVMTSARLRELGIPRDFTVRAIGRTRDVPGPILSRSMLDELDSAGRPTYLLSLDASPVRELPKAVQRYLATGEELKLPERALLHQRRPWYKMERRDPPDYLFAYLGRRNARFIRNEARAVPLTGFLCVYPGAQDADAAMRIAKLLESDVTLKSLGAVAKSYGAGALKAEPRALERLPIAEAEVDRVGLRAWLRANPPRRQTRADQLSLEV
jgi:hypothetical protein